MVRLNVQRNAAINWKRATLGVTKMCKWYTLNVHTHTNAENYVHDFAVWYFMCAGDILGQGEIQIYTNNRERMNQPEHAYSTI